MLETVAKFAAIPFVKFEANVTKVDVIKSTELSIRTESLCVSWAKFE